MAQFTLFFEDNPLEPGTTISLSEDTARHAVQVLRMKEGAIIALTNGRGREAMCRLEKAEKKRCTVKIEAIEDHREAVPRLHLAVAFTKHAARNEWLLEKTVELGVTKVIPLITSRVERPKYRLDRWRTILSSAMIQSQQYWMPELTEATTFNDVIVQHQDFLKLLPHCEEKMRTPLTTALGRGKDALILIGPEGDFTEEEVILGVAQKAIPVTLGNTRLRTENRCYSGLRLFSPPQRFRLMKLRFLIASFVFCLLAFGLRAQPMKLGLLVYSGGGDWYANPTSLKNLAAFCNENLHTHLGAGEGQVAAGSPEIFNYPFVHMTGHGRWDVTAEEAQNLRQ